MHRSAFSPFPTERFDASTVSNKHQFARVVQSKCAICGRREWHLNCLLPDLSIPVDRPVLQQRVAFPEAPARHHNQARSVCGESHGGRETDVVLHDFTTSLENGIRERIGGRIREAGVREEARQFCRKGVRSLRLRPRLWPRKPVQPPSNQNSRTDAPWDLPLSKTSSTKLFDIFARACCCNLGSL